MRRRRLSLAPALSWRIAICNPGAISRSVDGMKNLFIIALACFAGGVWAAPKSQKKAEPVPKPAATVVPDAPRERKPGFWERAWQSTKTGTQKAWDATKRAGSKTVDTVTGPFSGKKKGTEEKAGWRQLAMGVSIDPVQV